jgi:hypothetical protein
MLYSVGIVEPIRAVSSQSMLGLGKLTEYVEMCTDATKDRKKLEIELEETPELLRKRQVRGNSPIECSPYDIEQTSARKGLALPQAWNAGDVSAEQGEAREPAGVTRTQQARPLSVCLRSKAYGEIDTLTDSIAGPL